MHFNIFLVTQHFGQTALEIPLTSFLMSFTANGKISLDLFKVATVPQLAKSRAPT
jgi:hypothetical protein